MSVNAEPLINVTDYARVARGALPQGVIDYFEGGALDEITLRENTAGWERLKLYYRVLAGVGAREMGTTVLGQPISMPIVVAPTAFHNYGVLWQPDRITYFIDRRPVSEIKVPVGFNDPMYMIVNLAMGSKTFEGVGFVDGESPNIVAFEIDRISAYQIDER